MEKIGKIKVKWCKSAEQDHEENQRQYCHTHHLRNTICMCEDFLNLPDRYFWAILLHEIGHLIVGEDGDEKEANRTVEKHLGVKIYYIPKTPYGKRLEFIAGDINEAARKASLLIDPSFLKSIGLSPPQP